MKRRKIHCLNPISKLGTGLFPEEYEIVDSAAEADGILVEAHPCMRWSSRRTSVQLPCRAGVNNIPLDACARRGHSRVQYAGANANGVKELVIAGLILSSRDIAGSIEWCKKKKETRILQKMSRRQKRLPAVKSKGKKLGVIGLGAIGAGLPMLRLRLEWRFTDTIRLFPSMLPGCFPEM